ncbi:hypothetical protein VNO77_02595 [Canavalia gladiata]|uniref:Uncharacterized protein n=1 Tax=Canavalia gladiata TaxID=3824 RepID=A0AAN9RBF3_CANGL
MADNDALVIVMISITCVVGTLVAMYYLMTMIFCNKKYDITAYQNLLARAAMAQAQAEAKAKVEAMSMEENSLVSHLIPAHKYEKKKKNNDDVALSPFQLSYLPV